MLNDSTSLIGCQNVQDLLHHSLKEDGVIAMAILNGEQIVGANAAFDDLLGPLRGSGRPRLGDLILEDDAARVARSLQHALEEGQHALHLTFRTRRNNRDPIDCGLHWMRTGSLDDNLAVVIAYAPSLLARHSADDPPHLAFHDPKTGLATEAALLERLCRMWHEQLGERRRCALILLHANAVALDGGGPLDESAQDTLQALTGGRLAASVRDCDCVARRGDGNFAVLISHLGAFEDAAMLAERLVNAIEHAVEHGRATYSVQACAGVAVYPDRASDVQSMFAAADAALRRARESGQSICLDPVPARVSEPYRFRLLSWQDAYACGVELLDEQHRDLLERINDLANELVVLRDGAGLVDAYEGLVEAASHHFRTEEMLLHRFHLDPAHHEDQHAKLLADLKALRHELPRRRLCLTLTYLSNWLLQHVMGADQRIAAALREHDAVGIAAATATGYTAVETIDAQSALD